MTDYSYVAWFRDPTQTPGDEDFEWCACFVVVAANGAEAQAWGDRLAKDYACRRGHEFLRSYLDPDRWEPKSTARAIAGQSASDDQIGW